jgi:hypothetical protein
MFHAVGSVGDLKLPTAPCTRRKPSISGLGNGSGGRARTYDPCGHSNGKSRGQIVDSAELTKFFKTPLMRSANVISALFHDGVVVTESDNDRLLFGNLLSAGRARKTFPIGAVCKRTEQADDQVDTRTVAAVWGSSCGYCGHRYLEGWRRGLDRLAEGCPCAHGQPFTAWSAARGVPQEVQ